MISKVTDGSESSQLSEDIQNNEVFETNSAVSDSETSTSNNDENTPPKLNSLSRVDESFNKVKKTPLLPIATKESVEPRLGETLSELKIRRAKQRLLTTNNQKFSMLTDERYIGQIDEQHQVVKDGTVKETNKVFREVTGFDSKQSKNLKMNKHQGRCVIS